MFQCMLSACFLSCRKAVYFSSGILYVSNSAYNSDKLRDALAIGVSQAPYLIYFPFWN